MMEVLHFDTHRFVKNLTESGFTERQAEALAEAQITFLNENLATKASIDTLRLETKASIDTLRQETQADIARVEASVESLRLETKASIDTLRLETKASIDTLRQETQADIARVEASVESLRLETKASIDTLRQETQASILSAKYSLMKWMTGTMFAMTGLFAAIVKLLPGIAS